MCRQIACRMRHESNVSQKLALTHTHCLTSFLTLSLSLSLSRTEQLLGLWHISAIHLLLLFLLQLLSILFYCGQHFEIAAFLKHFLSAINKCFSTTLKKFLPTFGRVWKIKLSFDFAQKFNNNCSKGNLHKVKWGAVLQMKSQVAVSVCVWPCVCVCACFSGYVCLCVLVCVAHVPCICLRRVQSFNWQGKWKMLYMLYINSFQRKFFPFAYAISYYNI